MRIFLSTLFCLTLFLGCSLSAEKKKILQPTETIEIPAQGVNFNQLLSIDTYNHENTSYVVFLDIGGNYLSYDLEHLKIDTLLNFNQNFRAYGNISALNHIHRDSILAVFRDLNTVAIWNRKSMTLKPIAEIQDFILQLMQSSYKGLPDASLLPTLLDPPRLLKDQLYIPKEIALPLDPSAVVGKKGGNLDKQTQNGFKETMSDFGFLKNETSYLKIDVKNKTGNWITATPNIIPQNYLGPKTHLPMGHFRSNTLGANQELLVSHFSSYEISILNPSGQVSRIESVKSKYIKEFTPIPFAEIREKSKERTVTEPYYGALHYDPFRKLFYRFAIHRQPYLKKDKIKVNSNRDRSFSILVFDSNFEVLREHFFEPNSYIPSSSFVTENGLFMRSLEAKKGTITYHAFDL